MTYLCIGKVESIWAIPDKIRLQVNGRTYEIIKSGDNHYLVTLSGNKYLLRNYSIDNNVLIILVNDDLTEYFMMCESLKMSG